MHPYRFFARFLLDVLTNHSSVQINFSHAQPLVIKEIGLTIEGCRLIAISQSENTNLGKPQKLEMVFALHAMDDLEYAEPLTLIQESTGTIQNMYVYDDQNKRTLINPTMKRELTTFALKWFANLKVQGIFDEKAVRILN